jgi:hypothetical protein
MSAQKNEDGVLRGSRADASTHPAPEEQSISGPAASPTLKKLLAVKGKEVVRKKARRVCRFLWTHQTIAATRLK